MKRSIQYILIAILTLISFHDAYASLNYTVSPRVIDEKLEGRDIITRDITLVNTGSQPITIYPSVNNISLDAGGEIQEFVQAVASDRTTSLASWIEISRLGVDMKPGETKVFPLTLRINPNPKPGTYHALISFGNGGNRDEAERQTMNGEAPGTVVTVTIEDTTTAFLKLSRFIVDKFVTSNDNQAAVFTFTNPGDEDLVPDGEIIFFDGTGKEVGTVPINPDAVVIKQGKEHSFIATVPTDGLFGKYKAFLSVEYGNEQRASLQDTSFFYVFPMRTIMIIMTIMLVCVGAFAWHLHKKYFDEAVDDSERITFHVREGARESKDHDIDLKPKNENV